MKKEASVTVTMTLVLFTVISLLLVTLEHDLTITKRTLAFQGFNKALESILGNFYAPLYTEYGLLAVPVGQDFDYENAAAIEAAVEKSFERMFKDKNGMFDAELKDVRLSGAAVMTSGDGDVFIDQVRDAAFYDGMLTLGKELLALSGEELDLDAILTELNGELDENALTEEDEKVDGSAREVWNKLKSFMCDGFSGWWFSDVSALSTKRISLADSPSRAVLGLNSENADDELFSDPKISDAIFDGGDYLDELMQGDFVNSFNNALSSAGDAAGDKFALVMYAGMNMDNLLKNEYKAGALNYEQEYLVFGSNSDNVNVKRAGLSIFGIRLAAALIYIMNDAAARAQIDEWLSVFKLTPKLRALFTVLVTAVWAAENAIIETAAILSGRLVDLTVSSATVSLKPNEVLSFFSRNINVMAASYKGSSRVKLGYSSYIALFMFFISSAKLAFRMMDLIEANMRKSYGKDFRMMNSLTGFSCRARLDSQHYFTGTLPANEYILESAVCIM